MSDTTVVAPDTTVVAPATLEATFVATLGAAQVAPIVEQDLLVEDVSIDGMCGVY